MNIPEKIRIAGIDYAITRVPNLRNDTKLLYGQISYEDAEIKLSSTDGLSEQFKCTTLIHEILHGIAYALDIMLPGDREEDIIDSFARGIYMVLSDNEASLFNRGDSDDV